MKIRILGCHGSDTLLEKGGDLRACGTCGFLLNDSLLLDGGTIATALSHDEQKQISHVFLTHAHFDHIKALPILADNLISQISFPVIVAGLPEVITVLQRHIFNWDIYPDFFSLPTAQNPTLAPMHLKPGLTYSSSGVDITPILVSHIVPTTGFIVKNNTSAFVYSGDTYTTDELWHEARKLPQLKAVFIECSFPNSMNELARVSKHLTPALLSQELRKLNRNDVTVYPYHFKPAYKIKIVQELIALRIPNLQIIEEGQILTI